MKLKIVCSQLLLIVFISIFFLSCKDKENIEEVTSEAVETKDVEKKRFGGLALYTLRDAMGKDPKATLQAVVNAGYVNIEAAGYSDGKFYGMYPTDFKSLLDSLGLNPISTHQGSVTLENADSMIADVKAAGFKYFVVPVPPMGMFKYNQETKELSMEGGAKKLADILATLGQKCKDAGLELLYHNHAFEFEKDGDGNVVMDYLLENLDPELVNFQLDLYWINKAEKDPLAYFEKYPNRFKSWHVKDMDDQGRFAPVGKGSIDFAPILAKKDQAGMEYYFVEQDQTFDGINPLEAIIISHKGLKEIGFD